MASWMVVKFACLEVFETKRVSAGQPSKGLLQVFFWHAA